MMLPKLLLAAFLAAHLVTLAAADADADAQQGYPGHRGRLVVRKRKRPVGFGQAATTPQDAFQGLQQNIAYYQDNRDGRSLLSSPFKFGRRNSLRTRVHEHAGPVEPKVPRFSSFNTQAREEHLAARVNPFRNRKLAQGRKAQVRAQQTTVVGGGSGVRAASATVHAGHNPQVPGLDIHQRNLRIHQQQIAAQLALSKSNPHARARAHFSRAQAARRAHQVHRAQQQVSSVATAPAVSVSHNVQAHARARAQVQAHAAHDARAAVAAAVDHANHVNHVNHAAAVDHANHVNHVAAAAPAVAVGRAAAATVVEHHAPAAVAVEHVALPPAPVVAPQPPLTVVEHTVHHVNHDPAPIAPIAPAIVELEPVAVRQGVPQQAVIDIGLVAQAGERCVDKIVVEEEIESDEAIECHHSYSQKCHTTYTTDFEPQQEEECEENFRKNCFIEYNKVAHNETVEFCHTPLVKDCNVPGPVECRTEYESVCETRYHNHVVQDDIPECTTVKEYKCETVVKGYTSEEDCKEWPVERCNVRTELVTKSTPETACKKVPKEKCAPAGCGFVQGVPECFDKVETVIQEIPEEKCDLEPQKTCKHVTTLVPKLQPSEECVDVPKEVCSRSKVNPRKVAKPVVKKWCYTPTAESGLL